MRHFILSLAALLGGCGSIQVGREPKLLCTYGYAVIDDMIVGSKATHLSVIRRFVDGDLLCLTK